MGWRDMAAAAQRAVQGSMAEAVTYEPTGLAELTIQGVFSSAHHEVDLDLNVSVNTENPIVGVRSADLPADPAETDHVRIGLPFYTVERRYRVKRAEPDGQGWYLLFLVRAEAPSP